MVTCKERADHLALFVMLNCVFVTFYFIKERVSPAGFLLYLMFSCIFVTFPCSVLGQVWYLIVSTPDPLLLPCTKEYAWSSILFYDFTRKCSSSTKI